MSAEPSRYPEVTFEDPERPAYAPDGVDLTLIRYLLDLSPAERLAHHEGWARSMARLQSAFDASRG